MKMCIDPYVVVDQVSSSIPECAYFKNPSSLTCLLQYRQRNFRFRCVHTAYFLVHRRNTTSVYPPIRRTETEETCLCQPIFDWHFVVRVSQRHPSLQASLSSLQTPAPANFLSTFQHRGETARAQTYALMAKRGTLHRPSALSLCTLQTQSMIRLAPLMQSFKLACTW